MDPCTTHTHDLEERSEKVTINSTLRKGRVWLVFSACSCFLVPHHINFSIGASRRVVSCLVLTLSLFFPVPLFFCSAWASLFALASLCHRP
ncbi:hypothetical protein BKA60DRAFT_23817 [Fusarium oxysporum]|nr:hypothetical protein BKA60DRAFT_23817 [Fusarium oxysporum]